ncbi:MAG: dTDP-4-dehydrorhamnose 3,5-epimerase [Phyllobacterium sp.]
MRFSELSIKGVWLVSPVKLEDERGFFARTFCEQEFVEQGLEARFLQHSVSHSTCKYTLRGMHFQKYPFAEIKLVSCIKGVVYDVVADLRPGSATFRHWLAVELSPENGHRIYIPEGCAHGFQTLTQDAIVNYLINRFHIPGEARGVRYDDPNLAIEWPAHPSVISPKDLEWPLFEGAPA